MNQYDIFISHDSRDKEVAGYLKEFLEGVFLQSEIYVSGENIRGGDSWYDSIVSALRVSKVIVSLISRNSIDNNWVYFETGAGVTEGKSIPLLADGLDFSDLIKYPVSSIQTRKFDDDGISQLIDDIAELVGTTRSPKKENAGIKELVNTCKLIYLRPRAIELTKKLKVHLKNREQVEEYEEGENAHNRELQDQLDKDVERTRIHLKNYWIGLVNRKYNKMKSSLNGIYKYEIKELHEYLLSVGITSEADNYSDFNEAEKIQIMPSKRDEQEHGITLFQNIMERISPIQL